MIHKWNLVYFFFKLEEKFLNDDCRFILVARTNVSHNMDVTDATPSYFKQWLHQFSSDTDEYLHAVYQEHINLN